ncbi:hypothetical protein TEA_024094 [Camellia sinensis var. sinensis]|uniref:Rhamnogalacturonan lyase domain-containing protein n=1 Tax=Camellia sinensis var. sinensis TaxID=542762 RepID=A0A4S4DW21_CAMSN|nr:hypothetical protein TEA_024094 [Camellia sinensis var. sinensis]
MIVPFAGALNSSRAAGKKFWEVVLAAACSRPSFLMIAGTRKTGDNTYETTTWQIKFKLEIVYQSGVYKLRLALASAMSSDLEVRINDGHANPPQFSSGLIGKDNAIARHGIHGLYYLFNVDIPCDQLRQGDNTIFLTQAMNTSPFHGIMYDYIRLEGPPLPPSSTTTTTTTSSNNQNHL